MINPLTLYSKIKELQADVLEPLYTNHTSQDKGHEELLRLTAKRIIPHKLFIEEIFRSTFVKVAFTIVKALGFADQLTNDDFARFTNYVNDGGIDGMLNMLKSADMELAFMEELGKLPSHIQLNAPIMLDKARSLHHDFITGYLHDIYGPTQDIPPVLLLRERETDAFIDTLSKLAHKNNQIDEDTDIML